MTAAAPLALELRGIHKRFGTVTALDAAELRVRAGTVHALLGENGAGKTTLMRIAFGLVRPDAGSIEREGRRVRFRSPADGIAAGIGMVQQHFSLIPAMTVAENVALGNRGRYSGEAAIARVRTVCETTGLVLDPRARVADLPVGAQQRVEIVKAFARAATLLILDEPTAVLAPAETRDLLARLRAFAREGHAVVLITHKLREALDVADDITVLRRGTNVFTSAAGDATAAALVTAMVGTRPPGASVRRSTGAGDVVLQLERVAVVDERGITRLRDASVSARGGEIVGVAGVEGNGHRELLRVLAGRLAATRGRVERPPTVGFVPEDRHRDALVLDFTLVENVALAGASHRRGVIAWHELGRTTRELVSEFDVLASGPSTPVRVLSGGHQQRFVMGRELRAAPRALVVENPTRGLDVHATEVVHTHLRAARDNGCAIVVYTSDLDELLLLADRVLVCFGGLVREVPREASAIGRALVGAPE